MDIYPRHDLRPRYLGERAVYDLLSKLPQEGEIGFAVHSVNLPEHEYKRWGEADFVIVAPSGVTLLEVKGGTVTIAGREWRYENARGQAITSTEGPARQAISAAIELESVLSRHLGRKVRCRWGVVFPLCTFRKEIAELPPDRLADLRTCRDVGPFAEWLRNVPFDQHQAADFALEREEVEAIREVLLPEMCAVTSLGLAVRSNQNQTLRLTEQQFAILESLENNPRLSISGGAGTGKTELAALCARAEKAAGRRPAFLTTGRPLLQIIRSRMAAFGVPVVTEHLPADTDTLIVDEGQDLAQPAFLASLFAQLPGGLAEGRWRWFMDPNLQFLDAPPDRGCLGLIARNSTAVTLSRNVRSTREIVSVIRTLLDADVGISQIDGFGIRVGFHATEDAFEEAEVALGLVRGALEDAVPSSEIAVLGPKGPEGPICGNLLRNLSDVLRPLGTDGRIQSASHGVACGIAEFRGMEAGLVLLVDLDLLPPGGRGASHLYIGMSRARASLQLLLSPGARLYLKHLVARSD